MAKENIALVVDSTCGYTEKQIKKLGGFYVPLTITVDGKKYTDGVDLTEDELINLVTDTSEVKTSAPSAGLFEEKFKEALKTHDKVFCITISKRISSSIQSAKIAKSSHKEWDDKVFVCNSLYASSWLKYDVYKMFKIIDSGTTIEELKQIGRVQSQTAFGAFAPTTLTHLKNGGRISGSAAVVGNALKILPIITWVDGFMDPALIIKARTFKKASNKSVEIVGDKWKTIKDKENYQIHIIMSHKLDIKIKEDFIEKVKDKFKLESEPLLGSLSGALVAHVGPEFVGVGIVHK